MIASLILRVRLHGIRNLCPSLFSLAITAAVEKNSLSSKRSETSIPWSLVLPSRLTMTSALLSRIPDVDTRGLRPPPILDALQRRVGLELHRPRLLLPLCEVTTPSPVSNPWI